MGLKSPATAKPKPPPPDPAHRHQLLRIAPHVTPKTLPQAHNTINLPTLGALYQTDGAETALNALAWSDTIVMTPPTFDDDPRFLQTVEQLTIEQFVPHAGIEALDISVLPG